MGARKKASKPGRSLKSGLDAEAIRSNMQEQIRASTSAPPSIPSCLSKMDSSNPAEREEGCTDVVHIALVPANHRALVFHKAHRKIAQLLDDSNVHIKCVAAAALRNLLTSGADELLDEVVAQDQVAVAIGRNIQNLIGQYPTVLNSLAECVAAGEPSVAAAAASSAEDVEDPPVSNLEQLTSLVGGIELALEEMLQLASVVAEGNESSSQLFSSTEFLSMLVNIVCTMSTSTTRDGCISASIAAAECLSLLSSENDAVARFIASGLSSDQLDVLNTWIRGGPGAPASASTATNLTISPRLLRLSLALAGTLLNCAPNEQNAARVMPILCHALGTLPLKEWGRVLPLLSEDCSVAEDVRTLAIQQSTDRLRSLQAAIDLMSNLIGFACEQHDDGLDDETAFAQNPHAALLSGSGAMARVGDILQDLLHPYPDAIAIRALRESTPNGDASNLQHLFLSVEVGIFGLASTLLMMLPVTSLAPFATVWRATVGALEQRYALSTADQDSLSITTDSPSALSMLSLQMESLAEMCWTIQRKDKQHESQVLPQDLDVFTRLAWCSLSSNEAKVFCVGVVGSIGVRYRHASVDAMTACTRFCNAMLCEASHDIDVRAEAANSLMDLFDEESFDASLYIPIQLHASLKNFLARDLQPSIAASKRSGNQAQFEALAEISTNLKRFLQYKEAHCGGCA